MSTRAKPGQLRRELRFSRSLIAENLSQVGLAIDEAKPLVSAMFDTKGFLTLTGSELSLLERALGLNSDKPATSLVGELISVKPVPADTGVSYGFIGKTQHATSLGLVGLGFSDGIPRSASNLLQVSIEGSVFSSIGRIAMDQSVFDLQGANPTLGCEVSFFGEHYSLLALSRDSGFTPLEILGRITNRVARVWSE